MSNAGQAAVGIVGGVIGFFIGGPTGAAYGFQLGLLAGSALFPTVLPGVKGPLLTDERTTTATQGADSPEIWGTITVGGNTMWLGTRTTVETTEEVGGKGGPPSQEVTTYSYFQSIAIRLVGNRIKGVRRIWENGELVYDIRPQLEGESTEDYEKRVLASSDYANGFVLYLGTEDQMPSPIIEAKEGVGMVQGFRGTSYIVYNEWQLQQKHAYRHPNRQFELVREGNFTVEPITLSSVAHVDPWVTDSPVRDYRAPTNTHRYRLYSTPDSGTGIIVGPADANSGISTFPDGTDDSAYKYFKSLGEAVDALTTAVNGNGLLDINTPINNLVYGGARVEDESRPPFEMEDEYTAFYAAFEFQPATDADVLNFNEAYFDNLGVPVWRPYVGPEYEAGGFLGFGFKGIAYATLGGGVSGYPLAPTVGGAALEGWYVVEVVAFGAPATLDSKPHSTVDVGQISDTVRATVHFWKLAEVGIQRMPARPPNACVGYVVREGYCRLDNGTYIEANEWQPGVDEYWALQIFRSHNTDAQGQVVGPIFRFNQFDDPDFISQEFWDTTYAQAVVDGKVIGGKTYANPADQIFFDPDVYPQRSTSLSGVNQPIGWQITRNESVLDTDAISLAAIVEDLCLQAGLTEDQIDVADLLETTIFGYRRANIMPARAAIEALRPVGWFDVVESGRTIKFIRRGHAPVATLTDEDLGTYAADSQRPPLTRTRKIQDVELPRSVILRYIDETRDYQISEVQSPKRLTTKSVNDTPVEIPVVLYRDQAAKCAEVIWADAWRSRWVHPFIIGRKRMALEPTDVVLVPIENRLQRLRFMTMIESPPLLRQVEAVRDDDGSYVSHATAQPPAFTPSVIKIWGLSNLLLLDLPALQDSDDDAGFYAAAWRQSDSWAGTIIYRSADGGVTFQQIAAITHEATQGVVTEALPEGTPYTWDEDNELIVTLGTGQLSSAMEDAVLAGTANAAAYGEDGRWEIVQWVNAEQIAPQFYKLTKLLRGRRGTEQFMGLHDDGDKFCLLWVNRIPMSLSDRGAERIYKAVSINKAYSSGIDQTFVGRAVALKPFSPVDIAGARDISDDLTITWTRRGRLGQELPDGADIPLSEESEAYEIDILDDSTGGTVLRTLNATTTTVVYSAAQQVTDFGSAQPSVTVRIYQMSASVGRGTPGEATI